MKSSFNNNKTKSMKKTLKNNINGMVTIHLKKKKTNIATSLKETTLNNKSEIYSLAKKLKSRLSNAAKRLTSSKNNILPSPTPVTIVTKAPMVKKSIIPIETIKNLPDFPARSVALIAAAAAATELLSPPPSPIALNTTLSQLSMPLNNKTSLNNLNLLKQYLTFVSTETQNISLQQQENAIQFEFSKETQQIIEPETELEKASRLGATLIELSVHDPIMTMENPASKTPVPHNEVSKKQTKLATRRRPGRPSKSNQHYILNDHDLIQMKQKRDSIIQRQKKQPAKKKEVISCICETATEEFGTMVQCDDCNNWLHLDCLKLSEKALEETFRCPSCFIKLGDSSENNVVKLISHISWRYAAKLNSQVLAAGTNNQEEEEEEEEDEEEDSDMDIYDEPSTLGITSNGPPLTLPTKVPNTSNGVVPALLDINVFRKYEDECCSISDESMNSSQDGGSEAGTPSEYHFGDDFWLYPPNAANVFLCENPVPVIKQKDALISINPGSNNDTCMTDVVPSTVCAEELPEFDFWGASF